MLVVEGGNVLHHVKKGRGNCLGGGNVRGEYVQGECPDPKVSIYLT